MAIDLAKLEQVAAEAPKQTGNGAKRKVQWEGVSGTTVIRYLAFISPKIRHAGGKERITLVKRALAKIDPVWVGDKGFADSCITTQCGWGIRWDGGKPGSKGKVIALSEKQLGKALRQKVAEVAQSVGLL